MAHTTRITEVLRNRNFFMLWIGQIVSALGDRFHQMAIMGIILKSRGNVGEGLSRITFWSILPVFLFSLFSGALSDRWSRKSILIGSDLARAVLVCAIPWVVGNSNSLNVVYPFVFAIGIFTCLFSPAKFSIIPGIVNDSHLLAANSLVTTSALLSVLAGTVAGSVVFDKMGFSASIYIDAFTYLFSAGTVWMIRIQKSEPLEIKQDTTLFSDVKAGMKYICHNGQLKILIGFGALFWFVGVSFYIMVSEFTVRIWGFTTLTPLGALFTLMGAGLLAGSILVGKYGNLVKRSFLYTGSLVIMALGVIAFSFLCSYTAAFSVIFLIGVAGGVFLSPINADIHGIVPDNFRGKTFASKDVIVNAATVSPILALGKLTTLVSVRTLLLCLGAGILLASIFVAWASARLNRITAK